LENIINPNNTNEIDALVNELNLLIQKEEILILNLRCEKNILKDIRKKFNIESNLYVASFKELTKENLFKNKSKKILIIEGKSIELSELRKLKDFKKIKLYSSNLKEKKCEYLYVNEEFDIYGNLSYIKNIIHLLINQKTDSIKIFNEKSIEQQLFRNINTISIETIINDIDYLEKTSILTSRLGIFIYKFLTFNFNTSDKKIGSFYSEKFNSTSKVFNNRYYNIKNVKGYKAFYKIVQKSV
jgi:hypothetical protein